MAHKSQQLRASFLLTGAAAAVVFAGGVAAVGSQHARRTLEEVAQARERDVGSRIAALASAYIGERRREAERLAASPPIVAAARRASLLDSAALVRAGAARDPDVQAYLRDYLRHSDLADPLLTDGRGLTIVAPPASLLGRGSGSTVRRAARDETWWRSAWRDGAFESEARYDSARGMTVFAYAVAVRPGDGARPVGVLRVVVPADRLLRVLDLGGLGADASVEIVDPQGKSLAVTPLAAGRRDSRGSDVISASPANGGRWQVVFRQPGQYAYAIARATERAIWLGAAGLLAIMLLVLWRLAVWLDSRVTEPVRAAGAVAGRIAGGDLSVTIPESRTGASEVGELLTSVHSMVLSLRRLVGAIRGAADEASAMAAEISASTEQMSASTQEMSSTCQDLSRRSVEQAQVVRAAAEDTAKIFEIVTVLAMGADDSVRRNTNLSTLAQRNREVLDASTAQLLRLTEEVARGVAEADALAKASEEIQKFVAQAKSVATQTNMLALNAAIEAARAGPQGRGFAVVADEVRKLASVAANAASETADTVRLVLTRVQATRNRLTALAQGSVASREAAQTAAQGLATVTAEAAANDAWSREIAKSMTEVRSLVEEISTRLGTVAQGTEGLLAATEEIAASSEEQSASTEEIAASANQLAEASDHLSEAVKSFRLLADRPPDADRQAAD